MIEWVQFSTWGNVPPTKEEAPKSGLPPPLRMAVLQYFDFCGMRSRIGRGVAVVVCLGHCGIMQRFADLYRYSDVLTRGVAACILAK
jgi:hypothetical protein